MEPICAGSCWNQNTGSGLHQKIDRIEKKIGSV
jgi:hypothetical protein